MIAVVDYGSGNVAAIGDIFKRLKIPYIITRDFTELRAADRYILPGVGAFDATIRSLKNAGLISLLNDEVIGRRKKILGICVGMQILGDSSDEGILPGLGWIPGHIKKIDRRSITGLPKLPHMGWNSVRLKNESPLFHNVDLDDGFYFLHNYFFDAKNSENVSATVIYGQELPCSISMDNVYGVQFHPEKSHSNGLAIFRNFSEV